MIFFIPPWGTVTYKNQPKIGPIWRKESVFFVVFFGWDKKDLLECVLYIQKDKLYILKQNQPY